jgi:hypothetical protein
MAFRPSPHVFKDIGENRIDTTISTISHVSTPSTISTVWVQFRALTDTKDTKPHTGHTVGLPTVPQPDLAIAHHARSVAKQVSLSVPQKC